MLCDVAYDLMVGVIEQRAAAIAAWDWEAADKVRDEFDAWLVSEPKPESEASRRARLYGVR